MPQRIPPKLEKFWKDLVKYNLTDGQLLKLDQYDHGRVTLCRLLFLDKSGKSHIFEIRGFNIIIPDHTNPPYIQISAVNWTIMAATCYIELKEDTIDNWYILEDNPTMEVLYGN